MFSYFNSYILRCKLNTSDTELNELDVESGLDINFS